jgi:hypothetical protein
VFLGFSFANPRNLSIFVSCTARLIGFSLVTSNNNNFNHLFYYFLAARIATPQYQSKEPPLDGRPELKPQPFLPEGNR